MKILMVINDMAWLFSHRLPLIKAILNKKWDLSICVPDGPRSGELKKMGIEHHNIPNHTGRKNFLYPILVILALTRAIKHDQPDVIHAITIRHAFFTAIAAALTFYNGRCLYTIAGLGADFEKHAWRMTIFKFVFKNKNALFIFQNPDDRHVFLKAGIVREKQCHLIRGSGVDLDEFSFTPMPETDTPIVLFSSRIIRQKGIEDFIEAARLLKQRGFSAQFQIAGKTYPKTPQDISDEDITRAQDEGVVEWLGLCEDMPTLLQKTTLCVLPSYYGEGVPKNLLEAAAIGRPIITCDVPGCREIVHHKINGLLVPPRQPEKLADAIETLLNDPELCATYGRAGRTHVENGFSSEQVVTQTMAVYNK